MANDARTITIAGPGKNALGTPVMQQIVADLRAAGGRPVLLMGDAGAFSAGLNLKEVAGLDRDGMLAFLELLEAMVDALFNYAGPTVACVNGHAIAGGCVLALCCDHRVATDDRSLRIGLNEVALGLEFPPRVMGVVRHRVPPRSIERVTLEAGLHEPRRAVELGLLDAVASDVHAAATEQLDRLAAHPRGAYVATKRALRAGATAVSAEAHRAFRDQLVPAWCAPEVKERVLALLGRRG
jgi:enoyl-CoA hydratase/carnithine racemase